MPFWRRKKREPGFNVEDVLSVPVKGDSGSHRIVFASPIAHDEMLRIIAELRTARAALTFHDPLYPSPSDPGAYFDFTQENAQPNCWSMTLGNHGWTGGIYQIDDETLSRQIEHLIEIDALTELKIDAGKIFSHYDMCTADRNCEMIDRLRLLHVPKA